VYEYELIGPDGEAAGTFDWVQRMRDESLTAHPETGQPCRRKFSVPNGINYADDDPKTIGQLAERNRRRLQRDNPDELKRRRAAAGPANRKTSTRRVDRGALKEVLKGKDVA
jgi:hypothetical protein